VEFADLLGREKDSRPGIAYENAPAVRFNVVEPHGDITPIDSADMD